LNRGAVYRFLRAAKKIAMPPPTAAQLLRRTQRRNRAEFAGQRDAARKQLEVAAVMRDARADIGEMMARVREVERACYNAAVAECEAVHGTARTDRLEFGLYTDLLLRVTEAERLGAVDPALVAAPPEELAPAAAGAAAAAATARLEAGVTQKESLFMECRNKACRSVKDPSHRSRNISFTVTSTSFSSDEANTYIYECQDCGNTWRG
jgi:DNA-directed RNA polymerase subunit M/transcription elongation factor TFIIS